MKKSIMRGTLPLATTLPFLKILEPLKTAGFDGIQLGVHPPPSELTLQTADADVRRLGKACRDAGLEPHSIYGGIRFIRDSAADRKQGREEARRTLDIATLLGARTILIHPGHLSPALPYDACWRWSLEGLQALKAIADSRHLRLGLENVWNQFLMSPLEFKRLLDEVNSPGVGIWFDVGNVMVFGYPEQWLRILGASHLVGVHIKDFRRGPSDMFGTYAGFVPIFHGNVDWPAVMHQLAAQGFDDYLVTEVALGRQPLPAALQEISRQLDVLVRLAKTPA